MDSASSASMIGLPPGCGWVTKIQKFGGDGQILHEKGIVLSLQRLAIL